VAPGRTTAAGASQHGGPPSQQPGCLTASPIQFVQPKSIHSDLEERRVEAPREAPASSSCGAAAQAAQAAQPGGAKVVDGVGWVVQHGGAKHAWHAWHV
jgi:hypothetical protein